jgi:heptosyltransferase-2
MQPLKSLKPQNIIVRMPNWIGDLVMATPILSDLRKAFPNASITAMCRSPICELLQHDPEINELFCFSKATGFGRRSERRNIIEKLRKGKYDLGILLTHSFSSAWWFWQGKIAHRLGYDCNGRRLLLNTSIPLPENIQNQHLVVTYKMLLGPLGIPISDTPPRLYLTQKEIADASTLLKQRGIPEGGTIVGINPGATYGSAKCWLPERFRKVAERLLEDKDLYLVFFGDSFSRRRNLQRALFSGDQFGRSDDAARIGQPDQLVRCPIDQRLGADARSRRAGNADGCPFWIDE